MRALAVALLLACSLVCCKSDDPKRDGAVPDRPLVLDLPPGTTGVAIGPAGGSAASADGKLQLEVPAAALSKQVTITVSVAHNLPAGNIVAYDIGPTGLVFDKPVTLRIKYDLGALQGVTESSLRLGTLVGGAWQIVAGSTVDTVQHQVSGQITHLSIWGVVRLATPDAGVDKKGPVDITKLDLPKPTTSTLNEVWHEATGTPCNPAKMVLVAKPGAIEVQLTAIPRADVPGTCIPHTVSVTATGPTTLDVAVSGDTGSVCNTECWDFTFTIQGLPPGTYTVKYLSFTDTVTVSAASGG